MSNMKAYRDAQISLFQSAVSEVLEKHSGNQLLSEGRLAVPVRATTDDPMLEAVASYADAATKDAMPETAAPESLSILDGAKYCVNLSIKLGEALGKALLSGNQQEIERYRGQLGQFGGCDPRWAEAAEVYANYFVIQGKSIPYRSVKTIADPTIATPLGAKVRLAIVGDWGTGQQAARTVLSQIKDKNPAVVIHLGDVYYSGTQYEFDNYFSAVWAQVFGAAPGSGSPILFNLSGNHDMYSGGQAYYQLLDTIKQPASFFCLQNDNWQLVAMDTGLHDSNPVGLGQTPTFLDPDEAAWVCGKVNGQGSRKTILLSHHQLFSGYEKIGDSPVNQSLRQQLQDVLNKITMWLWGHEHNLVIFDKYQGVYGRCIGHGAFPVGIDEPQVPILPGVPVNAKVQLDKGPSSYQHGFAILDLDGPTAQIAYYQDSLPNTALYQEQIAADGTVTP
jgi:Calcineurin-like phosphoesterase